MARHSRAAIRLPRRRGVAALEGAIVLLTLLVFLFGGMDVAIALIRYNALSDAACRGARAAALCGTQSPTANQLGPTTMTFVASDTNTIASACRVALPTINAGDVHVTTDWPDADNSAGCRVRVSLSYQHVTLVPWLLGYGNLTLSAVATTSIAH